MSYLKTKDLMTNESIKIHYTDVGKGQPIVLIHGWPSSHEMWEYQINDLVDAGYRVIAYDRRGFGKSSKPDSGYDYDSLTDDLKALIEKLDLQDITLVGFSMGGGEVIRYFSRYGGERVSKIALISSITPYMLKTADNRDGVEDAVFADMLTKIKNDRINFLESFGTDFFGVSMINKPVSKPYLEHFRMLASVASPRATQECAKSFAHTDFRDEMASVNVPVLIIHGDADKIVPIATSDQTAKMIPDSTYLRYEGAPHGLFYTEKEKFNKDLLAFITEPVTSVVY